jgi:hypothetical protein
MTLDGLLSVTAVSTSAFVLTLAALSKLGVPGGARPSSVALPVLGRDLPARAVAAAELLLAGLAVSVSARVSGVVLALVFGGFAVVHVGSGGDGDPGCDCFGDTSATSAARIVRIALTAGLALLMVIAAVIAAPGLLSVWAARPATALLVTVGALLAATAWRWAFTEPSVARRQAELGQPHGLPERREPDRSARLRQPHEPTGMGERLVATSAMFLERRMPRRTLLQRVAITGSALAVAPLRYLLYPISALAAIDPGSCGGGLCSDGYTVFCCEINAGANSCPPGTFPGGWWMCTSYQGSQLCAPEGVRYYVDCNRLPGVHWPGGCECANGSCDYRREACNVFRYGQCNTQIGGVTEVVCRMVVCENPGSIPELNCSSSVAVDDAVCAHEAPCLEPPAIELVGAGGV